MTRSEVGGLCGVVLAGGWGTRLHPLTISTNKHLLPVYDEPMICKSIATLVRMGITEIMVVLGGYSGNAFFSLLGDGHRYGINLQYAYQEKAGGIAEALRLTKNFVGQRKFAVILGDNIFEKSMMEYATEFLEDEKNECYLFLKPVKNPESFGIAWINKSGEIVNMKEKPLHPDSNLAITGLYLYTPTVFTLIDEIIDTTGYSSRGELEITDINKLFMKKGLAKGCYFESHWADCGTINSLMDTSILMREWNLGKWLETR
ncbi:MAG: spore coat protein [Euryarchaeota archaeon]|nr:spore coat protein [Euryarchaeota archaeon]DAC18979.1 MAG TPA: spore coat protein [Candidatus Poseidoniales archaeon]HII62136.1 NTP transferase domain-containing protein [Candidatus Poseidoniaceae archaeon]|tara:strand:- start:1470 stop:2249 length:780 start_codon:yes stop_codon:yes gene_type:complete